MVDFPMLKDQGGQTDNVHFEFGFSAVGGKEQIRVFSTAVSALAWIDSHPMLVRKYDHFPGP